MRTSHHHYSSSIVDHSKIHHSPDSSFIDSSFIGYSIHHSSDTLFIILRAFILRFIILWTFRRSSFFIGHSFVIGHSPFIGHSRSATIWQRIDWSSSAAFRSFAPLIGDFLPHTRVLQHPIIHHFHSRDIHGTFTGHLLLSLSSVAASLVQSFHRWLHGHHLRSDGEIFGG